MSNRILEVCTSGIEGVMAARDGGAGRVELCSAMEIGGVTPSAALIKQALKVSGIKVHVLIRPRGGDFLYTSSEIDTMISDVAVARDCGAHGVVVGALTPEGNVDCDVMRRIISVAGNMSVTFHRAFDMCRNPLQALEDIISLGCDRILTSGQASNAVEGLDMLGILVSEAAGRIIIMPGCGVNSMNVEMILSKSGAVEVHASASHIVSSKMSFRQEGVNMGKPDQDEFAHKTTDKEEVRRIVSRL